MTRAAILMVALTAAARADVRLKLSLSGMALSESSDKGAAEADAANALLAYGDLRAMIEGRRLAAGIEFKGDFRLRLTGNFDEKAALRGERQVTARGYAGGREYDLRELWIGRRGQSIDFGLGRLIIREADALTLDGLRAWWRFHRAWSVSVFGGLHPDPFSRSLTMDYPSLAAGGGGSLAYAYPRVWGHVAFAGLWVAGPDDGGPIDPMKPEAPAGRGEAARVFLTWTNYVRAASWLSLWHDLVVDVAGAAGVQLTRADAGAELRLSRFRLTLGYAHLSSFAIEMYLRRLLNDRRNFQLGTLDNTLVVHRTARDEGRLRAVVRPFARFDVWAEGRVRRRALIGAGDDPNFKDAPADLAWDVSLGVRDDGDLAGLRLGASFAEIFDYRAETKMVFLDAGRDFLDERLTIDLSFSWGRHRDFGAAMDATCKVPAPSSLGAACFGRRTGQAFQVGPTLVARPSPRWFLLADYRMVYDTADGGQSILTHVAFARIEFRL